MVLMCSVGSGYIPDIIIIIKFIIVAAIAAEKYSKKITTDKPIHNFFINKIIYESITIPSYIWLCFGCSHTVQNMSISRDLSNYRCEDNLLALKRRSGIVCSELSDVLR